MLPNPLWKRTPGQMMEFLLGLDISYLAETLVAFANADGGTIVIGMDASGEREEGIFLDDVAMALQSAQSRCRPPVPVEWHPSETPDGLPVLLEVQRSPDLHSLDDGRVLIRSGRLNRPLGGEEILHLASGKGRGEFELEPVAGATLDDLDPDIIEEYLDKRKKRSPRAIAETPEQVLVEIGALDPQMHPTVAGMLLFGRRPQVFLPKTGIQFMRFLGSRSEPGSQKASDQYGRREEIGGPLPRLIQETWELLWQYLNPTEEINGLARQEYTDYPPIAVREAFINAVAHRDYRIRGRQIEIHMYDDLLEITSPGGLPGYITLENIVDEHFSRNPRIVNGLYYWGYIEELGTGIDRMMSEMARAGHPPPAFHETPFSFTVTLYSRRDRPPIPVWEEDMNERQLKALNYVAQHGRITNREYRQLCPDVTSETIRLDLADLVARGILLKIGDKRGTYYILK